MRGRPHIGGMPALPSRPDRWIETRPEGLYVRPGDFYVDPIRPVGRAVITHGHSDHARPGHGAVLATAETARIMAARMGTAAPSTQALAPGVAMAIGPVTVRLVPAGHVLGSAQVVLEHAGCRVVVSGDYKRQADPTCAPFEIVPCDVFVTEATFGLPVFKHPPAEAEIARLLDSLRLFPDRAHLVGVYALGKCQRVMALLRRAGYDRPVYLHGALIALCTLYDELGCDLGPWLPATGAAKADLKGQVVLCPPSALSDLWSRRLPDPLIVAASGWMRIRQRARQRGVELPLVISDHADWPDLLATMADTGAGEVWVTHGREEALVFAARQQGRRARALAMVGREEDDAE